jgi:hypothetical protein
LSDIILTSSFDVGFGVGFGGGIGVGVGVGGKRMARPIFSFSAAYSTVGWVYHGKITMLYVY